jgi:hypothetical protein
MLASQPDDKAGAVEVSGDPFAIIEHKGLDHKTVNQEALTNVMVVAGQFFSLGGGAKREVIRIAQFVIEMNKQSCKPPPKSL